MKYVTIAQAQDSLKRSEYPFVLKGIKRNFDSYKSSVSQNRLMKVWGLYHLRHAYLLTEQVMLVPIRINKLQPDALLLLMRVSARSLVVSERFGFSSSTVAMRTFVFRLFEGLKQRAEAEIYDEGLKFEGPKPEAQLDTPEESPLTKGSLGPARAAYLVAYGLLLELDSHKLVDLGHDAWIVAEDAYVFCDKYYGQDVSWFMFDAVLSLLCSLQADSPPIRRAKCHPAPKKVERVA